MIWLSCVLITGLIGSEPESTEKPLLSLQLEDRNEIVWTGTFREEITRQESKNQRIYDFESRLLVVQTNEKSADLALLTSYTLRSDGSTPTIPIARLELLRVQSDGKIGTLPPAAWLENRKSEPQAIPPIPIESLPENEVGMFLELTEIQQIGSVWDRQDGNRPYRSWKVAGMERPRGACCLLIESEQESDEWVNQFSSQPIFRRTESMLVSTSTGLVTRFQRRIEKKDAQSSKVNYVSVLQYDQKQRSRLSGEAFRERLSEIRYIVWAQHVWAQISRFIGREPKHFENLLRSIEGYEATYPSREELPYRPILTQIKYRAEIARRGDRPPDPSQIESDPISLTGLIDNRAAPDFLTIEFDRQESIRLRRLRGRPVVLLYCQPNSSALLPMLNGVEKIRTQFGDEVSVLFCLIGESEPTIKKLRDLNIRAPIYDGKPVQLKHRVPSTPYCVLLDREGIVRKQMDRWTNDSIEQIEKELKALAK